MTLRSVHQVVPSLNPADALGRLTLQTRVALQQLGVDSSIFTDDPHDDLRAETRPLGELAGTARGQAVLLHYAIASPATDAAVGVDARRGLIYYNITPEHWFGEVSRVNWERVRSARLQLPWLADAFELGLAHSEFSRRDLVEAGFDVTGICPVTTEPPPRPATAGRPRHTVLAVGRVAPHKRWEIAVRAVAAVRRHVPDIELELVGSSDEMEPYARALDALALRLDAGLVMRGKVSDRELEAAYARAAALVLPSAHEGFGVPPLEAMARGVPVVASHHGALPEVVGGAGLVCGDDPLEWAAAVERVLTDDTLSGELSRRGRERAAHFSPATLQRSLATALAPWGLP